MAWYKGLLNDYDNCFI